MLFPYLHKVRFHNTEALFHPLTFDVVFRKENVSDRELEEFLEKEGLSNHWIAGEDFSWDRYIDSFLASSTYGVIDIRTLKMFTTTKCNLACDYCLIEKNLETRGHHCKNISREDAFSVIDRFSRLCLSQVPAKRTIMLYGGEPLMNRDTVFAVIRKIREMEKNNLFNGPVEIDLECNGTLVTDEDAEFLKENNVFILISLDGIEKVHDTYRKKKTGEGSYREARRGFETLIRHGCTAVISSVFTDEYAKNLDQCLDAMTDEIKPKSIGLNLFHVLEDQKIVNDQTEDLLDEYIHAFEKARKKGLYIEHIMRRIRPLTDRKVRISDCGACGNRIVSDVDGNIGICEGLVGDSTYFFPREDLSAVRNDPEFRKWSVRTPLKMKGCIGCKAMGICGGGCVSNAIRQNNDLYSPDNYICESSKAFIDYAMNIWYNAAKNNLEESNEAIHLMTESERNTLLGCLGKEFDIPLQTVSKQFEKEMEK
ncbi:MAG: radical SAM protein [Solobacterium sp.]|nr:radical SAM protein [Solobacterium sp.]